MILSYEIILSDFGRFLHLRILYFRIAMENFYMFEFEKCIYEVEIFSNLAFYCKWIDWDVRFNFWDRVDKCQNGQTRQLSDQLSYLSVNELTTMIPCKYRTYPRQEDNMGWRCFWNLLCHPKELKSSSQDLW